MALDSSNVFSSSIIRTRNRSTNHYKDILKVEPATPVLNATCGLKSCDYEPKNDKVYIPKKRTGSKVKTIRDIRFSFEKDIYSYLENDLDTQKNFLLRKIRLGHSRNVKLREAAKKMLNSDAPVSKSIWRMLMNINPEDKAFSTQFVLWNGKNIQVNGSKGGNKKLISRYDISQDKTETCIRSRNINKVDDSKQKKTLLHNSLHVKFKPGPLTKKKYLDTSFQKHNFGDTELISLPKPCLQIQPTYGKPIPPSIAAFLFHSFEENSNTISKDMADFAVSVLGTNVNGNVQLKENCNVTYDLSYRCAQKKILMRHDSEMIGDKKPLSINTKLNQTSQARKSEQIQHENLIVDQIKNVIDDMLATVEISLEQDKMYTGEDEIRDSAAMERQNTNIQSKEKMKKRYCELDRLDVTVIRISEKAENKDKVCSNTYCNLGCICDSLSCTYNIKGHCGRIECMFQCKCDFSSSQIFEYLEHNNCTSFLPHIMNKNKKSNLKLAKEEQKFHQTVIVTEEKSIVLKSRKRDSKTPKKYACFYSQMRIKTGNNLKKELCVLATKLDCRDIEPLCLVHNLYKCFCKGKFIDTTIVPKEESEKSKEEYSKPLLNSNNDLIVKKAPSGDITTDTDKATENKQERVKSLRIKARVETPIVLSREVSELQQENTETCARIVAYGGRMFSNGYYSSMNQKIKEMEMNDKTLQKKLNNIIGTEDHSSADDTVISLKDIITNAEKSTNPDSLLDNQENIFKSLDCNRFPNKPKLVAWLESSYKQYKLKSDQGIVKLCLGPPKPGKLALYPWNFILSRYQERKNHFLVSNNKPFRLFMTVNERKQFFESSININNILWPDIDKYPITVKNLRTNAAGLQDNFCILYGLSHSWEIIGSVTKVTEKMASDDVQILNTGNEECDVDNVIKKKTNYSKVPLQQIETICPQINSEYSKWFVMTVEDDFSEIQFYNKGFFVKYESVIKAINVARGSNKTVRLSSHKCSSQQSGPQFGIYAIPSESDYCVFIGPYEKDEKLGIETLNTFTDNRKRRTRGVWITTKKIDNLKVIDNPLSFMPISSNSDDTIPLHSQIKSICQKGKEAHTSDSQNQNIIKTIKPIKICKTNGFYHLAANGIFQQISQTSPEKSQAKMENSTCTSISINDQTCRTSWQDLLILDKHENKTFSESSCTSLNKNISKKPVAEIAPQVKTSTQLPVKRKMEGMLILKPEEINKRSFEGKISSDNFLNVLPNLNSDSVNNDVIEDDIGIDMDIENFLATSVIQTAPDDDIFVISDDEHNSETNSRCNWQLQYIICKNIENLGWIQGRRDTENRLSFEFPGFKATEYYTEDETFAKINQVFSRKVYVPKYITLEWRTSDNPSDIVGKHKLHKDELTSDYIMTKNGLCHKAQIINNINLKKAKNEKNETEIVLSDCTTRGDFLEKKNDIIMALEETSADLETESHVLWNETVSKKTNIMDSFGDISSETRRELTNILSDIVSFSDGSGNSSP